MLGPQFVNKKLWATQTEDKDCDGVITTEDCDDENADFSSDNDQNDICDGREYCEGNFVVQNQEDAVHVEHCIEITGNLTMTYDDSSCLAKLRAVGGHLNVQNSNLYHLDDFFKLETVGGDLTVEGNVSLENIDGLFRLISIGGDFNLIDNTYLSTLNGLYNLEHIEGDLVIQDNDYLSDIDGLYGLVSFDGDLVIKTNDYLCTSQADTFVEYLIDMLDWQGFSSIINNDSC